MGLLDGTECLYDFVNVFPIKNEHRTEMKQNILSIFRIKMKF